MFTISIKSDRLLLIIILSWIGWRIDRAGNFWDSANLIWNCLFYKKKRWKSFSQIGKHPYLSWRSAFIFRQKSVRDRTQILRLSWFVLQIMRQTSYLKTSGFWSRLNRHFLNGILFGQFELGLLNLDNESWLKRTESCSNICVKMSTTS